MTEPFDEARQRRHAAYGDAEFPVAEQVTGGVKIDIEPGTDALILRVHGPDAWIEVGLDQQAAVLVLQAYRRQLHVVWPDLPDTI